MTTTTDRTILPTSEAGLVSGAPRVLLRLEGLAVLVASIALYRHLEGSWAWLAILFLVPDVSMLGYLAGPRVGAALYNAGHSHLGPALLAATSFALGAPTLLLGALIWSAHIGFDRMLGYGLKHGTRFVDTHLGVVGRVH
jgi:hypothetical protein